MIIRIEALDTLFFRDGKPFTMGDDTWANAMFPPLPSVLYGAIRSAYLGQNDIPLDEIEEATKNLKIKNIWYRIKTKVRKERKETFGIYLPQPLDLVHKHKAALTDEQERNIQRYDSFDVYKTKTTPISSFSSLHEHGIASTLTLDSEEKIEGGDNNLLSDSSFENYLKGQSEFEARQMDNYYASEPKIGIGRDNETFTSSEGKLYRVGMLRVNNFQILIEFENLDLEPNGLLRLGGEGKLAKYNSLDDTTSKLDFSLETLGLDNLQEFKICLTTPAIFDNGYYPTKIFQDANVEVELVTCAVGKAINVGGFDMQKRAPKEMQKAVPSGSVYYYKLIKGNLKDLELKIQENTLSESRGNEGFGIAYIAKI